MRNQTTANIAASTSEYTDDLTQAAAAMNLEPQPEAHSHKSSASSESEEHDNIVSTLTDEEYDGATDENSAFYSAWYDPDHIQPEPPREVPTRADDILAAFVAGRYDSNAAMSRLIAEDDGGWRWHAVIQSAYDIEPANQERLVSLCKAFADWSDVNVWYSMETLLISALCAIGTGMCAPSV